MAVEALLIQPGGDGSRNPSGPCEGYGLRLCGSEWIFEPTWYPRWQCPRGGQDSRDLDVLPGLRVGCPGVGGRGSSVTVRPQAASTNMMPSVCRTSRR